MARRLAMIMAALLIGAGVGTLVGRATVADLRADLVVRERAAGAFGVPVRQGENGVVAAGEDRGVSVCTDCSDFNIGYDWAVARNLRDMSGCAVDSWSFQQGCEAAVRRARGVGA